MNPLRRLGIAAMAFIAAGMSACATPDAPASSRNEAKQQQLEQMERAGQRNDDRPVRVQ